MRLNKTILTLTATTMIFGGLEAGPKQPASSTLAPLINLSWDMTPIDDTLSSKQVEFLNLYMNYSDSTEMKKLPRNVRENLPLYIALHSQQLNHTSLIHYRIESLLAAGMSFNEIAWLQETTKKLERDVAPNPQEMQLLDKLVGVIKKHPELSLNPWFRPAYSFIATHPEEFSSKDLTILREALLKSVGMTHRELKELYDFANTKSNSPVFSQSLLVPMNKMILIGHLAGVDLFNPERMGYLEFAVRQNRNEFSPPKVESFSREVNTSPVVEKYRYDTFIANDPNRAQESKGESQMNPSERRFIEQQRQMRPQQMEAYQREMQQKEMQERAMQQREMQERAYQQQLQQRQPQQMSQEQMEAYQREMQQREMQERAMQQQAMQQRQMQQMTESQSRAYQQQLQQREEAQMNQEQMQAYNRYLEMQSMQQRGSQQATPQQVQAYRSYMKQQNQQYQ